MNEISVYKELLNMMKDDDMCNDCYIRNDCIKTTHEKYYCLMDYLEERIKDNE